MELLLTADQEAFIDLAVMNGRYPSRTAAVQDALARWENTERARCQLIADLELADAEIAAGHYAGYSEQDLPALHGEIRQGGRAILSHSSR